MKHDTLKLTHTETLLKIILQKIGKKCKDEDFFKAREHLKKEDQLENSVLTNEETGKTC